MSAGSWEPSGSGKGSVQEGPSLPGARQAPRAHLERLAHTLRALGASSL